MTANLTGDNFVAGRSMSGAQGIAVLNQMIAIMNELPGGRASTTLVVTGGAITPTRALHQVDTEGAAATDNLDNAVIASTGMVSGRLLLLRSVTQARVVTVRHNQGGDGAFDLSRGSMVLDKADKWLLLVSTGTTWMEVARFYGADTSAERTALAMPLANVYTSAEKAFNARTYEPFAHGLGAAPSLVLLTAKCQTAEYGYSIGDEATPAAGSINDGGGSGFSTGWSSTGVWWKAANHAQPLVLGRKGDADGFFRMTNASWKMIIRCWR